MNQGTVGAAHSVAPGLPRTPETCAISIPQPVQIEQGAMRQYYDGSKWVTLPYMMRRRKYWHFSVTWKRWKLEYRYEWRGSPLWRVRAGPLWIILH